MLGSAATASMLAWRLADSPRSAGTGRATIGGHEVRGRPVAPDAAEGYAESVYSAATQEVLDLGQVATYTASGASDSADVDRLKRIGYRPFYRVGAYRGIKRGSGRIEPVALRRAP